MIPLALVGGSPLARHLAQGKSRPWLRQSLVESEMISLTSIRFHVERAKVPAGSKGGFFGRAAAYRNICVRLTLYT